jgi:hypothetical protein
MNFVSEYGLIATGSDYSDHIYIGEAGHLLLKKAVKVSWTRANGQNPTMRREIFTETAHHLLHGLHKVKLW